MLRGDLFMSRLKLISLALTFTLMLLPLSFYTRAVNEMHFEAKSVILTEASTGRVLYESNADEALPPASVTKIMTLLLVMEAIDEGKISLDDMVPVSNNAASMGGSQIYLEAGEQMSVDDMIKSVVVSSANDAAVALAEFVSGSEELFVEKMNERASELGMTNTAFENTNGLDDTTSRHVTSARDIAIMSRELIRHEKILEYSSIWMDSIRNGAFTLTNTNRLIRFYKGANGLKTGSTSKAGFCISATAKRDGMQLIAVVMGAANRDTRNEIAKKLLDYGFANYSIATSEPRELQPIKVYGGVKRDCKVAYDGITAVVGKGDTNRIEVTIDLPDALTAPIYEGDAVGSATYTVNGEIVGKVDITASESVGKIGFREIFPKLFEKIVFA